MSDWAALLPGIAAIITSTSSAFVAVWAVTRGSKRERRQAARNAIDRATLGGSDEDDEGEFAELIEEFERHRKGDES